MSIPENQHDRSLSDPGDLDSMASTSLSDTATNKANRLPFRVCRIFYRLFLPIALLSGCIFRYNFVSLLYLVLLLVAPCVPGYFQIKSSEAGSHRLSHSSRAFVFIMLSMVTALIMMTLQIGFNVFLWTSSSIDSHSFCPDDPSTSFDNFSPTDRTLQPDCTNSQKVLNSIGIYRLDQADFLNVCRIILPDIVVLFVALSTLILHKTVQKLFDAESLGNQAEIMQTQLQTERLRAQHSNHSLGR